MLLMHKTCGHGVELALPDQDFGVLAQTWKLKHDAN